MQMDNFMRINLTKTFGAGNEPDLATCDEIFSDYFEGEILRADRQGEKCGEEFGLSFKNGYLVVLFPLVLKMGKNT